MERALVVVDVQRGFTDPSWGRRDEVDAERNIAHLVEAWQRRGGPVVFVRHDSRVAGSPLAAGGPGNDLDDRVLTGTPDLLVTKTVNSCFYGEPDLDRWLRDRGVRAIAICGITTNHCCETTARMAGNLGYDVQFIIDATVAFDLRQANGEVLPAELVRQVTAANLDGEFARVVTTRDVLTEADATP